MRLSSRLVCGLALSGAASLALAQAGMHVDAADLEAYAVTHQARCAAEDFPGLLPASRGECHIYSAPQAQAALGLEWSQSHVFVSSEGRIDRVLRTRFLGDAGVAQAERDALKSQLVAALGSEPRHETDALAGGAIYVWDGSRHQVRLSSAAINESGEQILVLQSIRRAR